MLSMIECRRSQWLSYHISKSQIENNEKSTLHVDNVFIFYTAIYTSIDFEDFVFYLDWFQ